MFTFRALALAGALLADAPSRVEYQLPDAALESAQARGSSVSVVVSLYIFGFLILWATVALCVGLGLLMLRAGKNLSDPPSR